MTQLAFAGPWPVPEPVPLEGPHVRLEPLDAARHGPSLAALTHGDPVRDASWDWMAVGPFADDGAAQAWLATCAAGSDPLFFALLDRADGRAKGVLSLMRITPAWGTIEIGNIWLAPEIQRTALPTAAYRLLFAHALETLGYRRLEWKCNASNLPSRRAAARLGFTYEGTFRQHMVVKGRNRDTAWFALLDHEWPAARAALDAWLDPANFDPAGRQLFSLADLR